MKELWKLYSAFFRIGLFTFGGGYAMMPLIQKEVVEKNQWTTTEEVLDYYAVSQCTPGVIAVNTATFIGYKIKKTPGGVIATLGVVTPSVIIVTILASILERLVEYPIVQHAFVGVRIAVIALVINTVVKMLKNAVNDAFGVIMFAAAFVLCALVKVSSVWIVIAAGLCGVLISRWKNRRTEGDAS